MALSAEEHERLTALVAEASRRAGYKFSRFFPDVGPFARAKYPKQLEFFAAVVGLKNAY